MDDDADAAREYERLRAELAEFVLDVLSERIAAGQEPKLSQALIDAIDRRVEEAVSARLAATGPAHTGRSPRARASEPVRGGGIGRFRLAAIGVGAIALIAAVAYIVLRVLPAGPTNTSVRTIPPANDTTVIQVENGQITPPSSVVENGSAPAPAPQPGSQQP